MGADADVSIGGAKFGFWHNVSSSRKVYARRLAAILLRGRNQIAKWVQKRQPPEHKFRLQGCPEEDTILSGMGVSSSGDILAGPVRQHWAGFLFKIHCSIFCKEYIQQLRHLYVRIHEHF
nr:MAG TPA: hypothetical protein [Caudoviricetes sp.]